MYLLRLALRPLRLAPLSQIFSALMVGFLLLLAGFLFWMQKGLSPVLARLQGEQVLTVYLKNDVQTKDIAQITDAIRIAAGAHPNEVKYVDAPKFISELKGYYQELGQELEDLGDELNSVVPRYVSISSVLPASALDKVKIVPGVEFAESSRDRYRHIIGAFKTLRWVSKLLVAGLCFALLTGLLHLSRMNTYLHQDALSLLRLWGADNFVLRIPGMLSGLLVGFTGGAIAFLGWMLTGEWLTQRVRALSPILKTLPMPNTNVALSLLLGGAIVGIIAGALGGLSSRQFKERRS